MKVVLFGAERRDCRGDPGRRAHLHRQEPGKVKEILLPDVGDLSSIEDDLTGYDACFPCLGVSSPGMKEAAYRKITYDLTVAAGTTIRLAESGGENRILDGPAIHASAAGSPAR
jgi:hypothetical protein